MSSDKHSRAVLGFTSDSLPVADFLKEGKQHIAGGLGNFIVEVVFCLSYFHILYCGMFYRAFLCLCLPPCLP